MEAVAERAGELRNFNRDGLKAQERNAHRIREPGFQWDTELQSAAPHRRGDFENAYRGGKCGGRGVHAFERAPRSCRQARCVRKPPDEYMGVNYDQRFISHSAGGITGW